MFDLHVHSVYSDGELLPSELARRFAEAGYGLVGITDHVDFTNVERVREVRSGVERQEFDDVDVHVGAELTHVPPDKIPRLAGMARDAGAEYVVVHGETVTEPVPKGTNRKALESGEADILAHPGPLATADAELARESGVYLEITTRSSHGLANGSVAAAASKAGAGLVLNSDFHHPKDLPSGDHRRDVAEAAGLSFDDDLFLKDPREILG